MSVADRYWGNVAGLLHFDETPGSSSFGDVLGNAWTRSGTVTTAAGKFGNALTGSDNGWLQTASPDVVIGTEDFTLDAWVRCATTSNSIWLYDGRDINDGNVGLFVAVNSESVAVEVKAGGELVTSGDITLVNDDDWHHVAISRKGQVYRSFVDGNRISDMAGPITPCASTIYVGASSSSGSHFAGQIDDWRVTRGAVRYWDNFQLPSHAAPDEGYGIPCVTQINGVARSRQVRAFDYSDGTLIATATSALDGAVTLGAGAHLCAMVISYDDYGQPWAASATYGADAKIFSTTPNGHWYQTTSGGTSGTTEPTWPTDGTTVTDGNVIWTDMGTMRAPVIQGPFIPVPVT